MAQINLITQALLDAAVALRAPLASPAFTGAITLNGVNVSADATVVDITRSTAGTARLDTTLTADSVIQLPIGAADTWDALVYFSFTGDPADDGKIDIQGPTGLKLFGQITAQFQADGAQVKPIRKVGEVYPFNTLGTVSPDNSTCVVLSFRAVGGGTAGTITFRLARNGNVSGAAGAGTALTPEAGSFITAVKRA